MTPHARNVDPAEENDADDEGEIWYNPIPEDDDTDNSDQHRLKVPLRAEPQRRPSKVTDLVHAGRTLEGSGSAGPEALVENLGGGSGDVSQGNAVHSTEALHMYRQMLACKPQEEGGPSSSKPTGKAEKKRHPHILSFQRYFLLFISFFTHSFPAVFPG